MTQPKATTVRLKVSPQVASIVGANAPRDAKLSAARGATPLHGKDLLTVLFFLCNSKDVEIKKAAVKTLRGLPVTVLEPLLKDEELSPQLLELLVKARFSDAELMAAVIVHPAIRPEALNFLARKAGAAILERLAEQQKMLEQYPQIVQAILANPETPQALKVKLGSAQNSAQGTPAEQPSSDEEMDEEALLKEAEAIEAERLKQEAEKAEKEGLSKFQLAMEMKVAEKIKMGITGDKEWRNILIKESNKLIQGAVMKNPRITDGEVLMVAKTKTSSDDLIRAILLNKDWLKLYDIKKALVIHPKTPAPKAMRMVQTLTMKDIKDLARSRQVSTLVATAARKELELRIKKQGG
ncbi:MAG: hypothetical protein OET90_10760 [Desulfuromonadales bacterium]|nr:hypothetical protein [Desulfuromonadales bacterium]